MKIKPNLIPILIIFLVIPQLIFNQFNINANWFVYIEYLITFIILVLINIIMSAQIVERKLLRELITLNTQLKNDILKLNSNQKLISEDVKFQSKEYKDLKKTSEQEKEFLNSLKKKININKKT